MAGYRKTLVHVGAIAAATLLFPAHASTQQEPEDLNAWGVEARALATQVGVWDVTETVWPSPGAKPTVTHGVALRRMIGSLLEETLHVSDDLSDKTVSRIDYLGFNRLEGRWNYVSMDTRVAAVGIMTANSFERDPTNRIQVTFLPFAMPGSASTGVGQLLRMDEVIQTVSADETRKDQHFILADGTARQWLAHRYVYVRRPATE
ncbi:MAG TPA: hypothetical protein VM621_01370 [Luteibacter sp.]|uniref:DUF1579 family protein n=1 Tax=Luteibacter sp. TaxID=1886636 RepID=UPI002C5991EE|nr:hypothetical protein [Luteibacter sp.]HVI53683.1 hypothetical protein [Luteibacter sp.]